MVGFVGHGKKGNTTYSLRGSGAGDAGGSRRRLCGTHMATAPGANPTAMNNILEFRQSIRSAPDDFAALCLMGIRFTLCQARFPPGPRVMPSRFPDGPAGGQ
jgi:hypothetical protein